MYAFALTLIAAVIGGVFGAKRARKRNRGTLDTVHYATVYAIVFFLISVFLWVILLRLIPMLHPSF